jgi:hypothetical protein
MILVTSRSELFAQSTAEPLLIVHSHARSQKSPHQLPSRSIIHAFDSLARTASNKRAKSDAFSALNTFVLNPADDPVRPPDASRPLRYPSIGRGPDVPPPGFLRHVQDRIGSFSTQTAVGQLSLHDRMPSITVEPGTRKRNHTSAPSQKTPEFMSL